MDTPLPTGKLPAELLTGLFSQASQADPRVLVGPGIGLDCAVVDAGDRLLVLKADPITFASDEIGYYLVQVNCNDLATTGAVPRWLLVTLLLPEGKTDAQTAARIMAQIHAACADVGITVVGGHTEITPGVERPIVSGALVGEVARDRLITPRGAQVGDRVLLTKCIPIETTSLLARELGAELQTVLSATELQQAKDYLTRPGIGVLQDARIAQGAGRVTAMHDPTEGGLVTALWELAEASGKGLVIDPRTVPVPPLARRVCRHFSIDPFHTIASGALLLTAPPPDAAAINQALEDAHIGCSDIGEVTGGPVLVQRVTERGREPWPRPPVDEITLAYGRARR